MKHEFSIVVVALALLGGDSADTFFWSGGNDNQAEFAQSAA